MEVVRPPLEVLHHDELQALQESDAAPRPPGWRLSPRAVRTFICGPRRKFYGDDVMVERAIITLASNRGLLLVGEPGTAKSMLSELLAAAISGTSTNTIQGSAGVTEDQIKYSWNYALLLAQGPSLQALVQAPLLVGMRQGLLVRFEEITRCPPEVQDTLVSVMSDKLLVIPELEGEERVQLARPGFNLIATANTRDRGVHEMSAALKRRFNFETVHPLTDVDMEVSLVTEESMRLLAEVGAPARLEPEVVELLVRAFHDMRSGVSQEGIQVERPTSVMSTAEAVSVTMAAALDAYYYGDGRLSPQHVVRHLASAVQKDNLDDLGKLKHYLEVVVRHRQAQLGGLWSELFEARRLI